MVDYLVNNFLEVKFLIWILNMELIFIYVIEVVGLFVWEVYEVL